MSPEIWLIIIVAIVGFIVQMRLQSVFAKYSKVPFPGGMTGRDVAEKMLRDNGILDVQVVSTRGSLTDNFNPGNKTVNLSESVYGVSSVAAAAVAAHECGHALQHARGYAPLKMRSALVPIVSFASQWAMWVILAGIVFINTFPQLFWIGIAMQAAALLFSLVTLPVEINASRRSTAALVAHHVVAPGAETRGVQTVLTAAAFTYIAAAVSSLMTLLYWAFRLGLLGGRRRD